MAALGINLGYLIMQILGIIILMTLLINFAYNPILNILDERKSKIAKGLEDARQASIARDNAEMEAKRIIDEARSEAAKIRSEAVGSAEDTRKSVIVEANNEAATIRTRADEEAESRRNQALGDMRGQIAAISMAAANKIVGETMDEKRQRHIINDFFAKVPASVSSLSGTRAQVTSALPLTDAEEKAARGAIKAKNIDFKVNPDILGGLIVKVDDQIVDNSVAGQMSGMRESIAG